MFKSILNSNLHTIYEYPIYKLEKIFSSNRISSIHQSKCHTPSNNFAILLHCAMIPS